MVSRLREEHWKTARQILYDAIVETHRFHMVPFGIGSEIHFNSFKFDPAKILTEPDLGTPRLLTRSLPQRLKLDSGFVLHLQVRGKTPEDFSRSMDLWRANIKLFLAYELDCHNEATVLKVQTIYWIEGTDLELGEINVQLGFNGDKLDDIHLEDKTLPIHQWIPSLPDLF